jgi:ketosteroid isomerase-like protein
VSRQFDLITDDDDKLKPEIMTTDALCIDENQVDVPNEMPGIGPGQYDGQHTDQYVTITMSRDGKSAWASFFTTLAMGDVDHGHMPLDKRVSDFIVQTPQGWRIAARAWTDAVENPRVNKEAKAGKRKAQPLKPEAGDASLNAAFAKLTTDGATNVAKDLVAIGSGPGERTVGAPAFTKPWNAAWKGKTTIVSSVARVAPSGTTGWVAATVELQKTGYKIPFTVFAVFDKDGSGAWTLVHIHFTV